MGRKKTSMLVSRLLTLSVSLHNCPTTHDVRMQGTKRPPKLCDQRLS